MINDKKHRELLKERYEFSEWAHGQDTPSDKTMAQLPDKITELSRIERYAITDGYIDTYSNGQDIHVTVEVVQKPSHDEARESMIDFLMTSMALQLPGNAVHKLKVGDVAFSGLDDLQTSLVFVRNNFFVRIHSVGKQDYNVINFAKLVDQIFM